MLLTGIESCSVVQASEPETGQKGGAHVPTAHPGRQPTAKPGLKLTQILRNHGSNVVYVSTTSLRVVNGPTNCEFIWTSPESTLWIVNNEAKRFFSEPLERWYQTGLLSLSIMGREPTKSDPSACIVTNTKFEDLDCHLTSFTEKSPKPANGQHAKPTRALRTGVTLTTLSSKDFKTPARILCLLSNIPLCDELPLRYINASRGHDGFLLQTRSVAHEPIPPPASMPPKGFTRTKTVADVLVSMNKKHDFEDLMKDLNVGEDFGTTSKNK
jgi:hypothetical protein